MECQKSSISEKCHLFFFFFILCDNDGRLKILLEEKMTKKLLFVVLFTMLFLVALTVSVSADQDGNSCWCNNDQYGCWITGEKGGRNYIMFWSESARDYIMGKGSKAPIVEKYSKSKLPLECGIVRSTVVVAAPAAGGDGGGQQDVCHMTGEQCDKECVVKCGPEAHSTFTVSTCTCECFSPSS